MDKIGFCGSSYIVGVGLDNPENEVFCRLVAEELNTEFITYPKKGGRTVDQIFAQSIQSILENKLTIIMCNAYNGEEFIVSLNGLQTLHTSDESIAISNLPGLDISKARWITHGEVHRIVRGDINEFLKVVDYIPLCQRLADKLDHNILLINTTIPYVNETDTIDTIHKDVFPILSEGRLIESDHHRRSITNQNLSILKKYWKELSKFNWLTFEPVKKATFFVDMGNDNMHFGPKSHRLLAKDVVKYIKDKGLL